ncbi:MAG: hypothetical protein RLZ84_1186 [Actinomycetota bacterium]
MGRASGQWTFSCQRRTGNAANCIHVGAAALLFLLSTRDGF